MKIQKSSSAAIVNSFKSNYANVFFLPGSEAGHLVARTTTRLELECARGTLLAERQQ